MNVKYDFSDKVVLVTGAGSGIGRATATAFAASGAMVIAADISESAGEETVAAIKSAGGRSEFHPVDVSNEKAVRALIQHILDNHGKLDIAHNNAGIEGDIVPMCDLPSDNWGKVIDVDLSSVFYCMKAEIPAMISNGGGAIVNTASVSGLIGGYNLSAYTAAKHGVVGLTKAAATDYGASNIRINALCPGAIDTPFIAEMPPVVKERLEWGAPIGRLGKPEEMAMAVLWLCSDGAAYVNGHSLAVDGGVSTSSPATRFDDLL